MFLELLQKCYLDDYLKAIWTTMLSCVTCSADFFYSLNSHKNGPNMMTQH